MSLEVVLKAQSSKQWPVLSPARTAPWHPASPLAFLVSFTETHSQLSGLVSPAAGSSDRRRRVPFQIPHSLVFLPDRREVCVADRENGRIQCFIAETGEFVKEIKKEEFGGEVFAITYSPAGGE